MKSQIIAMTEENTLKGYFVITSDKTIDELYVNFSLKRQLDKTLSFVPWLEQNEYIRKANSDEIRVFKVPS